MIALGSDVLILTIDDARVLLAELERDWTLAKVKRLQKAGVLPAIEALRGAVRDAERVPA